MRRLLLPSIVALAGVLANAALSTSWGASLGLPPILSDLLRIASLAAAAIPGLYALARAENRYEQAERARSRRKALDDLRAMLTAAVKRLFPREDPSRIRANVMIVDGTELAILTSVNMELYPDAAIRLDYGQGCAGAAWRRACEAAMSDRWAPVLARNARLDPSALRDQWHLCDELIASTTHVLWVLSVPIFYTQGAASDLVGVLNFDGVSAMLDNPAHLEDPQLHKDCADIAEYFASHIAENRLQAMALGSHSNVPRLDMLL